MEFILALITLTFLEVVLGIDNIIFISLVTNRLPKNQREKARISGLAVAMIFRIALLISLIWVLDHLTTPLFPLAGTDYQTVVEEFKMTDSLTVKANLFIHTISIRELVLFIGGLFLLGKSVSEIHHKVEGAAKEIEPKKVSLSSVIAQIVAVDIVFSFDSILTAIGITHNLPAMIIAIILAVIFMMFFAKYLSEFISKHPSLEILALSFLILIGFMLILDGVHIEVPRGYIYFALFFSLGVEFINMQIKKKKTKPIKLNPKIKDEIKNQ